MDASLRNHLEFSNPWLLRGGLRESALQRLPSGYVPRALEPAFHDAVGQTRKAVVVIGPRQVGKSTLVWRELAAGRPALYLNAEEARVREWCTSPATFVGQAKAVLPEGGVLFLEEAQWLSDAGLFVKGVVDAHSGWTVVVTGSSSFHLAARTRESLAGRALRFQLWPLSLKELAPDAPTNLGHHARREKVLDRLLRVGGYPDAWSAERPQSVLAALVDALVIRDASDRFRIARPDAFRRLMQLVAGQVGDLVNNSEWASLLGISAPTVNEYTSLLEETHIVRLVRPFAEGRRVELTSTPKAYFIDLGLRNSLMGGFGPLDVRPDLGKLHENHVFLALHSEFPEPGGVRYWRTRSGAEVDFVVQPEPGRLVGVEVKAGPSRGVSRGARSFIDAYQPSEFWVVHGGDAAESPLGPTRVRFIPYVSLPEAIEGLRPADLGPIPPV